MNSQQNDSKNQKEQSKKKVPIDIKTKYVEFSDVITIVATTLTKFQALKLSNFTLDKLCIFVSRVVKEICQYEVNIDKVRDLAQKCSNLEI